MIPFSYTKRLSMIEGENSRRINGKVPIQRQSSGQASLHSLLSEIAAASHRRMGEARDPKEYLVAKREADYTTSLLRQASVLAREHSVNPGTIPVPRTEVVLFQAIPTYQEIDVENLSPDEAELYKKGTVGKAFAFLKDTSAMTLKEFGEGAGYTKSFADKIVRGARVPSKEAIERLCDSVGVPEEDPRRRLLQQMAINERLANEKNEDD